MMEDNHDIIIKSEMENKEATHNKANADNNKECDFISKDPMELSQFFKNEGIRFFYKQNYDVAMIYFSKALDFDPKNKTLFSNRSTCHFVKGNYKMAVKDAKKCIELDPTYLKGYMRLAQVYVEMNLLEQASEMVNLYKQHGNEKDIINLSENIKIKKELNSEMISKYPSYEKFLKFENFLHEGDIQYSKLEIKFISNDHRGVVSKHEIKKDEIILKVPKDMLISIELAKTTSIGEKIAQFMYNELNSPKHSLLTSYLLHELELDEDSKWKSYLDILPKDFSSFPIFFTDEEMNYLDGSPFKTQVIEKKEDIRKDYNKICGYIEEFQKYSFEDFCKIRMAVSSRIFGVKIDSKKTDILAPFADLLNHKRPRSTHWFYDEKYKSFIIQSLEDIPKGLEVYDSYGRKCNSRFLLNYGFIIEDNDANEFPITLYLDKTCPNFEHKKILFKKEQDFMKRFRISENIVDYQVVDFFSFLRFITYDGDINILFKIINDNQKLIFEEITPSFYLISPISKQHEKIVLTKIKEIMSFYLNKYPSTYDEDLNILNTTQLTYNQRNCILMRMSEKKILEFYLNFSNYCLDIIDLSEIVFIFLILLGNPKKNKRRL